MKTKLKIGFVGLCDSAALIVGKERGFFAEQGLSVELSKEPSWANIRDKLACGILDAAHMLAPMVLEATIGAGNVQVPLMSAFTLSTGGIGITLGRDAVLTDKPVLAMVYPFSAHHYVLRSWMEALGIAGEVVVIPPAQMVSSLAAGSIQGFCVGAPWNGVAENSGLGVRVALDQLPQRMDKVLGVTQDWSNAHPETHGALVKALLTAGHWVNDPDNHPEIAEILAQPAYLNLPPQIIQNGLAEINFVANAPSAQDGLWYLSQMQRWGQIGPIDQEQQIVGQIFCTDTYQSFIK